MSSSEQTENENSRFVVMAWPARRNAAQNPYNALLYENLPSAWAVTEFTPSAAATKPYDVLHIHWPELMLRGAAPKATVKAIVQAGLLHWVRWVRRKPIVWTVHNFEPHDRVSPLALRILRHTLRSVLTGAIYLSETGKAESARSLRFLRDVPAVVTPIGRYATKYPTPAERTTVRRSLAIAEEEKLIVYAGRLDRYKGIDTLVAAAHAVPDNKIRFVIAGKLSDDDYGRRLRKAIDGSRVVLEPGWVDDQRLVDLFAAADLAVFPYRKITNSSSILLPLEYETPVLAPALGSIPEFARLIGNDWVRTYEGELRPEHLTNALRAQILTKPDWSALDWRNISQATADFLEDQLQSQM